MLNLKNNENDAVFDEICKKTKQKNKKQKTKIKIRVKFQKMKGTFLDSIPRLKSHQPPLVHILWVIPFLKAGVAAKIYNYRLFKVYYIIRIFYKS